MKQLFILLTTVSALSVLAQESPNIHNLPYVEVNGEGEMKVAPDEIYLDIRIDEGDKMKGSVEALEKQMIKALEEIGIDSKSQLTISKFQSDFKNKLLGQNINTAKEYELKLKETAQVPQVFVQLEKLGISNIRLKKVDHSDRKELELQVQVLAVKAAKEKATRMLTELGEQVGGTLYIRELNRGVYPMQVENTRARSMSFEAQAAPMPDLDFETITFFSSVQVRFQIASQ